MTTTPPVNIWDDILADLITTNEIGDGTRDYREADGVLYLDCYDDADEVDSNGLPIPNHTYRIDIAVSDA